MQDAVCVRHAFQGAATPPRSVLEVPPLPPPPPTAPPPPCTATLIPSADRVNEMPLRPLETA